MTRHYRTTTTYCDGVSLDAEYDSAQSAFMRYAKDILAAIDGTPFKDGAHITHVNLKIEDDTNDGLKVVHSVNSEIFFCEHHDISDVPQELVASEERSS